jgi:hypothetical protein
MSYTINLTNGSTLIPGGLSDGKVDTSHTSIVLVGKNYAGYGQFIAENFVKMLENFANTSGPANPLRGQLWWDTINNILKVYSGTSWKISTGATSAPFSSPPGDLSTIGGDLWFDTSNTQLKVYSGSQWITVGPVATPATGDTGAVPALMADSSSSEINASHIVIQFRFSGKIYAILSKDTFSCNLPGFSTIKAGLNFSTIESPAWGISTQDINATASTLVQRDPSGAINATTLNATLLTAGTINAPFINGALSGSVAGNVVATTINTSTLVAAAMTSTGGITAQAGFSGTILTASQPNITTLGNVYNLSTNGNTSLTGYASYNGSTIATLGGSASFSSINYTPIGNIGPSTGAFSTLTATTSNVVTSIATTVNATQGVIASTVQAGTIGNTGATLTGTLSTASQPNLTTASSLTSVGLISSGTWRGNAVQPSFGGTGVNNASNFILLPGSGNVTINGGLTFNQSVASGASPTFAGTNFSSIPNGALTNSSITINGTSVSLGGSYNASGNFVSSAVAGTGVSVSGATGAVTFSIGQAVSTSSAVQFASTQLSSLGVGTAASGTAGEIRATNNITAYYSDDRLKTRLGKIENALDKICSLEGFYYEANQTAQDLGYTVQREMGISAQSTQLVAPEIVKPAPIDDRYLTVQYERFAPLIIEAIKELRMELNDIKSKLTS